MAKKEEKGLLIATPTVISALEILKAELMGLRSIAETQYKNSVNVQGFPVSIDSCTDIVVLVKMHSSVSSKARAYNNSLIELGVKEAPVFKMNDTTVEDFEHNIKLRIAVIQHEDRKKELEELVKEGEAFLTKEDQYQIYLKKLQGRVGV